MRWSLLFIAVLQLQLLTIQGQEVKREDEVALERRYQNASTTEETAELIPEAGLIRPGRVSESCRRIKQSDPNAPSKMYNITVVRPLIFPATPRKTIEVYCEMGLNGGGYTFLTPESIVQLHPSELSSMFTDKTSFLLRVRKTDGSQPYAVLKQLSQYSTIPLTLRLSDYSGFNPPVNAISGLVGQPFLYFGFLPTLYAANNNVQGLQVNGFNNVFTNCDRNPNSHFTLFPNFPEATPSTYDSPGPFCDRIFSCLLPNPLGRVMPPQIFMFGETHWGGCGCYKQTNRIPGILSFAIGFR